MEREQFTTQSGTAEETVDQERLERVLKQSVDPGKKNGNQRGHRNLIAAMEELSELSKELSKQIRGRGDRNRILEELADVQLAIYTVQEICGISGGDLYKAVSDRVRRLEETLNRQAAVKRSV